jgi:thiamine-phosphate pyrophosphorylase
MKPGAPDCLYLIADTPGARWPLPVAVEAAVRAGVRLVQLRAKELPDAEYLPLARDLRAITRARGARLLINSRVHIAMAVGADGVHLPRDASIRDAREALGADALVGVSAHSAPELRRAEMEGANFVTLSPVFPTTSKPWATDTLGLDGFAALAVTTALPVFALGGITPENAPDCLRAGAFGVAVVSAIMAAPDVGEATKRFLGGIAGTVHHS